jgi:hypothetical protein
MVLLLFLLRNGLFLALNFPNVKDKRQKNKRIILFVVCWLSVARLPDIDADKWTAYSGSNAHYRH